MVDLLFFKWFCFWISIWVSFWVSFLAIDVKWGRRQMALLLVCFLVTLLVPFSQLMSASDGALWGRLALLSRVAISAAAIYAAMLTVEIYRCN